MRHASYHTTFYGYRRNSKRLWRSGRLGNAFKHNMEYYARIPALRTFYNHVERAIEKVFALTGSAYEAGSSRKVKAQLSICYTDYPAGIIAAIGHTAWVQYKKLVNDSGINIYNIGDNLCKAYLQEGMNPGFFEKLVLIIRQTVSERLAYEELKQSGLEQEVESYRFFLAANDKLRFHTLAEIIRAVIILGDLLPDFQLIDLYELTRELLFVIGTVSAPFFIALKTAQPGNYYAIGEEWIKKLIMHIIPYLPRENSPVSNSETRKDEGRSFSRVSRRLPASPDEEFPGFDRKVPPMLEAPQNLENLFLTDMNKQGTQGDLPQPVKEFVAQLSTIAQTIQNASGQKDYEDTRSDILLSELLNNPFAPGSIEGVNMEGNEVEVDLGDAGSVTGQIFDKALELSYDLSEVERLKEEARPITEKMKSDIYPSDEEILRVERIKSSGTIDPGRLPYYEFTEAIHKRFILEHQLQKEGQSLVLLVCDGSGSMTPKKYYMLRLLTVAWLESTIRTSVKIMAGIYNEGTVSQGRYGPILEWIYHPMKTVSASQKEAVRAVASIPERGSGGQKDALALSYCLQEAASVARGKNIYLIHITDLGWCNSFGTALSAEEEILHVIQQFKNGRKDQLHYTLVGLHADTAGKIGQVVDEFISLSEAELNTPFSAASKIAVYCRSILKKQRNRYQQA